MRRSNRGVLLPAGGVLLLLVAGLGSCVWGGREVPPTPRARMWAHFSDASTLEFSLAMGDLEAAREAAARIETGPDVPGLDPTAQAQMTALRQRASDLRDAPDLPAAALAAARMAVTCGACHRTHGGPTFANVPARPDQDDVSHMVEHIWAADRLWEGLLIPSEEHWEAGSRVLADHVVPMDLLAPGTGNLGVQLKSLGLDALQDQGLEARVVRYAEILDTCARCHMASGVGG